MPLVLSRFFQIADRGASIRREVLGGITTFVAMAYIIVVNPAKHFNVKAEAARAFAAFLVRADVQKLIGTFGVATAGEPLFVPDAGKPEPAG